MTSSQEIEEFLHRSNKAVKQLSSSLDAILAILTTHLESVEILLKQTEDNSLNLTRWTTFLKNANQATEEE